jgi:diguanylate cyclase
MPDTSIEMAMSLSNKLREMLVKCNLNYNDEKITVTASVGVSEFVDADTAEIVMKRADQALYKSKNDGRNRCTSSIG